MVNSAAGANVIIVIRMISFSAVPPSACSPMVS
jgi:hypothetical protein